MYVVYRMTVAQSPTPHPDAHHGYARVYLVFFYGGSSLSVETKAGLLARDF